MSTKATIAATIVRVRLTVQRMRCVTSGTKRYECVNCCKKRNDAVLLQYVSYLREFGSVFEFVDRRNTLEQRLRFNYSYVTLTRGHRKLNTTWRPNSLFYVWRNSQLLFRVRARRS